MLLAIPGILSATAAALLCERLQSAAFVPGRRTAGAFANDVKNNRELPAARERLELGQRVYAAIAANPVFNSFALVRRMMLPIFSRYDEGMAYGPHTDEAILGMDTPQDSMRSDLALTLFLSAPESYEGGELSIETPGGRHACKLPAGEAVVYPSRYLHEVRPVTQGVRFAAVTWIQSYVREAEQRELLYKLAGTAASLRAQAAARADIDALYNAYHTLLRMWAAP